MEFSVSGGIEAPRIGSVTVTVSLSVAVPINLGSFFAVVVDNEGACFCLFFRIDECDDDELVERLDRIDLVEEFAAPPRTNQPGKRCFFFFKTLLLIVLLL